MRQPRAAEPPLIPAGNHVPVSLADLRDFLDDLGHETPVARRTLSAYRVAVTSFARVLAWADTTDLSSLDINAATRHLRTATAGEYTTHTRNTYIANARRAIALFLGWTDHGFDWQTVNVAEGAEHRRPTHAVYRFPLREDVTVTLRLPTDLTAAEAARLGAFITALPIQPDDGSEATYS